MGAREYGALLRRKAEARDMSMSALARELVVMARTRHGVDRAWDASAITALFDGRRRVDPMTYNDANDILGISEAEAEAAMLEHYRRFRETAAVAQTPNARNGTIVFTPLGRAA